MEKLTRRLIYDEKGSVLPLIAVVIILVILVGSYQLGSIFVYRDRAVVRDAIDSACTSALASSTSLESHYTSYTEKKVNKKWKPRQSSLKYNLFLDEANAEATAKSHFQKIIDTNEIKATLVNWDFTVEYDDRNINVYQKRNHTSKAGSWWAYSSRNGTKSTSFPRWVKVTIEATVDVPIPMGGVFGKTSQNFTWKSSAIKELTPDKAT